MIKYIYNRVSTYHIPAKTWEVSLMTQGLRVFTAKVLCKLTLFEDFFKTSKVSYISVCDESLYGLKAWPHLRAILYFRGCVDGLKKGNLTRDVIHIAIDVSRNYGNN